MRGEPVSGDKRIVGGGHVCKSSLSFRDAPLGAGPESILTIVVMDSLMCNCTSQLARFARAPE
jgi:hypothetical protein